jgi:glycosyltransferase involved in cell wall biosynthesis
MKLLIYSHFFAPSIGGVETIGLSLARGLSVLREPNGAPQFEITLATQTPPGSFDDSALPFRVIRRPGLLKLLQLIRSTGVVHVAGPAIAPMYLALLWRKPLVIEHHGYQATCPNGLLFHHPTSTVCRGHFLAREYRECLKCNSGNNGRAKSVWLLLSALLRNAASRRATANIAPSLHVASRQALPCTTTIAHGIEDPYAGKDPVSFAPPISSRNFAYLGRLVIEKGLSILLEATRLLRIEGHQVKIVLIGDGPDRPHLEKQVFTLGLEKSIHFAGFLSGANLDQALHGVGTIIMPTTMEETAGLAAMEQMARGRAVIASRLGGLVEAVGAAGLTFSPGEPRALAEAMGRILDEPGLCARLGAAGRDRILKSFPYEAMIEAHARIYREVSALAVKP